MASTQNRKKSGRSGKSAAPAARPVRREAGGAICLLLALCVILSCLGTSAIFIDWLAGLLRGLFGWGYYLFGPALALAGCILLLHRGRPVALRVSCALALPVLFGTLGHMLAVQEPYDAAAGFLKALWADGRALRGGGAVSGALGQAAVAVFSRPVSVVLVIGLMLVLLMAALRITLQDIIRFHRERPRYEEESLPPPSPRPAPSRRRIDIPLDSEGEGAPPPEEKPRFTGFFRHKSKRQMTPDQVLAGGADSPPPAPPVRESEADPPAPPPPPPEPADIPPRDSAGKKAAAQAVAEEAAAVTAQIQEAMLAGDTPYRYPPVSLLHENREENHVAAGAELRNNSRRLGETLSSFGVDAAPGDVIHGPSVTRYEFTLEQGVKLSKITNLQDDIALALGASGVRIAAVPEKIAVVGIEVPNRTVTPVLIRDVIESRDFAAHPSRTAFALGRDIGGKNIVGNIERLPHVLIAGTTGSGKSVCTNALIVSLLYKSTPEEVRFIMVDPKMVELAPYNGIPHLLIPVVTDPKKAAGALQWAVFEMMKRYRLFSEQGVKKLEEYNRLAAEKEELERLPSVVVVIDELADLMLVAAKEVEESICRVAQMGRAAGMHLVIATQRPSADVITGLMKANIPSRIAFAVASSLESRIILDTTGAEKLVGRGDMLYAPLGEGKPARVQGCFISPEEIEEVVSFVKESGEANYSREVMAQIEQSIQEKESKGARPAADPAGEDEAEDELLTAAVEVVLETGQASVSMLQRRLKLGYARAARLVDQMEQKGIVGPFEGSKPRQLLMTRQRWDELQMGGAPAAASGEAAPPFDLDAE